METMLGKKLVSSWYDAQGLPENYVQSPQKRPGHILDPACMKTIPVIDLGDDQDRSYIVEKIIKACQEYGFFQAINHGVSKELIDDSMRIFKEFHEMAADDKVKECSKDPNGKSCKLYTSSENYDNEKVHYWKDSLLHLCHPLDDHIHYWPQRPSGYREVVGRYTTEVKKLAYEILDLIAKGLGLTPGKFCGSLADHQELRIHSYPPCPDPSLTLGLTKHCDPGLITLLLQGDVKGLQVYKDDEWISVDPIPYAFVVNIGYVLQIISNGKLIGAEHRAVTNSENTRSSAAYLFYPTNESIIEPEISLLNPSEQPLYKSFKYKDFYDIYLTKGPNSETLHKLIDYVHA